MTDLLIAHGFVQKTVVFERDNIRVELYPINTSKGPATGWRVSEAPHDFEDVIASGRAESSLEGLLSENL